MSDGLFLAKNIFWEFYINMYTLFTQNFNNLNFTGYERTFVMLKPDAFKRNLDSVIMDKIKEDKSLIISKTWEGVAPRKKVEKNWESKRGKSFFKEWMDFMTSGKVRGMVVEGEDAVSKVLNLKIAIRNKFAKGQKRENLVHSSDTVQDAKREIGNFFDYET